MPGDHICPNCGGFFCRGNLCVLRATCDRTIESLNDMSMRPKGNGKLAKFEAEDLFVPDPYETLTEETVVRDDPVNSPSHYNVGGVEVIDAIEAWGLDADFCLANAIKYIARAGKKDPTKTIEDLEKAGWYLNRRIARLKVGK